MYEGFREMNAKRDVEDIVKCQRWGGTPENCVR